MIRQFNDPLNPPMIIIVQHHIPFTKTKLVAILQYKAAFSITDADPFVSCIEYLAVALKFTL